MGNSDLRELAVIEDSSMDAVSDSTMAIDAHHWLYKYITTTVRFTSSEDYTTADGVEVPNLLGFAKGLPTLLEEDITPVFVFDGVPPELKREEIEARKRGKQQAEAAREEALESGDAIEAAKQDSRAQRLTDEILGTSRELLNLLDIPVVEAPQEGEAQCAAMAIEDDDVDYVATSDYDALLYGAPTTVRNLTGSGGVELMQFEETLQHLGLTREQLVDAAILCGTDYNDGVSGVGPKTSVDLLTEHGDIHTVLDEEGYHIESVDSIRSLLLDPETVSVEEYGDGVDYSLNPDVDAALDFVVDEWEIPEDKVTDRFDRIRSATTQTGLDRWT